MVDAALHVSAHVHDADATRAVAMAKFGRSDRLFRAFTLGAAISVLVILGAVFVSLIDGSLPALRKFGFSFFTTEAWNPVKENFGALAPVYGTMVTSALAMLIAVPIGLGIAIFLTELCPPIARRPIGIAIE
jgi:phosphate transport system permease protein